MRKQIHTGNKHDLYKEINCSTYMNIYNPKSQKGLYTYIYVCISTYKFIDKNELSLINLKITHWIFKIKH